MPLGLRRFPINGNAQIFANSVASMSVGHLIGMASIHFFKHDVLLVFMGLTFDG